MFGCLWFFILQSLLWVQLPVPLPCTLSCAAPSLLLRWQVDFACSSDSIFFLVSCTTDPQSKPWGYRKKRKNSLMIMVLAWNLYFYTLCHTYFVTVLGSPLGDGWQKVFLSLNYLLKCKGDCISKYPQESCPVCVHLLSAKVRSLSQIEKVVPCLNFLPWLISCLVDNLLFPNVHVYFFFFKSIHTERYIWECFYNMY